MLPAGEAKKKGSVTGEGGGPSTGGTGGPGNFTGGDFYGQAAARGPWAGDPLSHTGGQSQNGNSQGGLPSGGHSLRPFMAIQVKTLSSPFGPPASLERVPGQPGLLMLSARVALKLWPSSARLCLQRKPPTLTSDGDGVSSPRGALIDAQIHKHGEGALARCLDEPPRLVLQAGEGRGKRGAQATDAPRGQSSSHALRTLTQGGQCDPRAKGAAEAKGPGQSPVEAMTVVGERWLCPRALLQPPGLTTHSHRWPCPWRARRSHCCFWLPWASGWAEPRQANWCSHYCHCAGGHVPPRGSGEGKEGAQGWVRPKTR